VGSLFGEDPRGRVAASGGRAAVVEGVWFFAGLMATASRE